MRPCLNPILLLALLMTACSAPSTPPPTATPTATKMVAVPPVIIATNTATPTLGPTGSPTPLPTALGTPLPTPPGSLVWSDEFDYTGLPDPQKWDYEEGYIRNSELQYYTRENLDNARVQNGVLVIEAHQTSDPAMPVTSASLITHGKFDFTYGSIEVRALVPPGTGTWPAIWTLGSNIDEVNWPLCGEVDIMEYVGHSPNQFFFTVHNVSTHTGVDVVSLSPYKNFHVFRLDWTPQALTWYFDGKQVHTYPNDGAGNVNTWPFDKPMYLLLNLAIGGSWGGQMGVRDDIYPAQFLVDYVRIYQPE